MAHNVIVYSTPTCPWCVRVKEYFEEKKIKYTHYDVSKDQENVEVTFTDSALNRSIKLKPDLLVLASAIVP